MTNVLANSYSPTVRLRRLSNALSGLREECGMTRDYVARQMDWTPSKITRIESRQWSRPSKRDVRDLLDVYGVTDPDRREAFATLTEQARDRGWWAGYGDILGGDYVGLEAEAESVCTYQPLLVPGLLQTEPYARAVIDAAMVTEPEEVERRVEVRMTRQQRLTGDNPLQLWVVLDEAVLHRPVGGKGIMLDQLLHIRDMAKLPHVTIQVVPQLAGAYLAMGQPLALLSFPETVDSEVVYLENICGELYLEESDEIARYTMVFDHMRAAGLRTKESVALIDRVAKELRESWKCDM